MKDIFKQPMLYYIVVPVILLLWPVMVWLVHIPNTAQNWQDAEKSYVKSQKVMGDILKMDSARLDYGKLKKSSEFDYSVALDTAAKRVGLPFAGYTFTSKPIRKKTQQCQVTIQQTDITKFAKFLSTLQFTWADLQCEKVTLTKKQGLPDAWKIVVSLKYYY